jgi:hypothetical protein
LSQSEWSEGMLPLRKSKRELPFGYMNRQGQVVVPFKYDDAQPFSEGRAAVANYDELHQLKWGFIDTKGKLVVPMIYSNAPTAFSDGLSMVVPKTVTDFSAAFINRNGEIKFRVPVGAAIPRSPFNGGWIMSYGNYMDTTGKNYSEKEFKGLLGLPDSVGVEQRTAKYGQVLLSNPNHDKVGLYDFKHHTFIPPIFCRVGYFDEKAGLAYAAIWLRYDEKNRKNIYREGFINREGIFVIARADDESTW